MVYGLPVTGFGAAIYGIIGAAMLAGGLLMKLGSRRRSGRKNK